MKACLVARGFEEVGEIRNDSPTCMKESIRVALSVMVSKEWKCQSLDVNKTNDLILNLTPENMTQHSRTE